MWFQSTPRRRPGGSDHYHPDEYIVILTCLVDLTHGGDYPCHNRTDRYYRRRTSRHDNISIDTVSQFENIDVIIVTR